MEKRFCKNNFNGNVLKGKNVNSTTAISVAAFRHKLQAPNPKHIEEKVVSRFLIYKFCSSLKTWDRL